MEAAAPRNRFLAAANRAPQCEAALTITKKEMAGTTRLELATSGVTGRRSNQLNYASAFSEQCVLPPKGCVI